MSCEIMEIHVCPAKPLQIGNPVQLSEEAAACNKRNKQVVARRLQTKHANTGLQTEPATHMVCLGIYFKQLSVSFWGFSLQWSAVSYLLRTHTVIQSFWTSFNWWLFCVCPGAVPTEHALARVSQAWSQDSNTSALYKKILAANYQPPSFISESVKDLISGLLTVDPAKRCLPKMISLFAVWLAPAGWWLLFGFSLNSVRYTDYTVMHLAQCPWWMRAWFPEVSQ